MTSDRWMATCQRCGRLFEVGHFTRQRDVCVVCEIELDSDSSAVPEIGILSVGKKLPTPDDWPDVERTPPEESEIERGERWTREDHEWTMRHWYWGKHPKDR